MCVVASSDLSGCVQTVYTKRSQRRCIVNFAMGPTEKGTSVVIVLISEKVSRLNRFVLCNTCHITTFSPFLFSICWLQSIHSILMRSASISRVVAINAPGVSEFTLFPVRVWESITPIAIASDSITSAARISYVSTCKCCNNLCIRASAL